MVQGRPARLGPGRGRLKGQGNKEERKRWAT